MRTRINASGDITPARPFHAHLSRLRRRARAAKQLRCAFTGRFMRRWVPVTHGPMWALDVDASLAPEVSS